MMAGDYRLWSRRPMLSRFVMLAALLITTFALIMGAIRVQPYDDHGLREFFLPPEGCPAPCFMGIRPGVTTVEETIEILNSNSNTSISEINITRDGSNSPLQYGTIYWRWITPPVWADTSSINFVGVQSNVVSVFSIKTNVTLGSFALDAGQPGFERIVGNVETPPFPSVEYWGWYDIVGWRIVAIGVCPTSSWWHVPVYFAVVEVPSELFNQADTAEPAALNLNDLPRRCQRMLDR
jgi:hypothetical protein